MKTFSLHPVILQQMFKMLPHCMDTSPETSDSIHQSPYQQQSAVCQTRPQSDAAPVVLINVPRINSKWSSSTTSTSFISFSAWIHLLIDIFLSKYNLHCTDPPIRLMPSAANCCYEINRSWYRFTKTCKHYMYKHWRLFCRFSEPKIVNSDQHLSKLFENIAGVWNFLKHSVCS